MRAHKQFGFVFALYKFGSVQFGLVSKQRNQTKPCPIWTEERKLCHRVHFTCVGEDHPMDRMTNHSQCALWLGELDAKRLNFLPTLSFTNIWTLQELHSLKRVKHTYGHLVTKLYVRMPQELCQKLDQNLGKYVFSSMTLMPTLIRCLIKPRE